MRPWLVLVFAALVLGAASASAGGLSYCAAPPTPGQKFLCTTDNAQLHQRAAWLEELSAAAIAKGDAAELGAHLARDYQRLTRKCLSKKAGRTIACVHGELEALVVDWSRRVVVSYGLSGPQPGRYRYKGEDSVTGEALLLRHADGRASWSLNTIIAAMKAPRMCVIEAPGVACTGDGPACAWTSDEQKECTVTARAAGKDLDVQATAACEGFYCGMGATFTGRWTLTP